MRIPPPVIRLVVIGVVCVLLLTRPNRVSAETRVLEPSAVSAFVEKAIDRPTISLERLDYMLRPIIMQPLAWYRRTPPTDRIAWGGLVACAGLGLWVLLERLIRIRARKVIPVEFTSKFINSLNDGKLDCGQALDHCERNPSPAARVALSALRRLGRPTNDLERAVALAAHVECDRLRRNVATLRRIALLAPLIGSMGTLFALSRTLEGAGAYGWPAAIVNSARPDSVALDVGHSAAEALTPLLVGVVIAILALVAYDGLSTRVEKLSGALERLGAETVDAIAMIVSSPPKPSMLLTPHPAHPRDEQPETPKSVKHRRKRASH
jgi:biopolymer transport protein ExbB